MQLKRVVITGMGALTPLGNSITEYWNNLRNGVSGCDFITGFDASKFKTRFACEIKNFEPTNYLDRKEARKVDRFTQIALVASDQAVQDAGIDANNVNHDRVGVILGSGIGVMPDFKLSSQERDEIVAYLEYMNTTGKADPRTFIINTDGTISQAD